MNQNQHKRSAFSGKIGFVLSAAGASVGLGNIWRFPYLAAKYGGGIFLLIYIILAFTFGYTMIVAAVSYTHLDVYKRQIKILRESARLSVGYKERMFEYEQVFQLPQQGYLLQGDPGRSS